MCFQSPLKMEVKLVIRILFLWSLIISLFRDGQTNKQEEKTVIVELTKIDIENPPKEGAVLKIEKTVLLRSFCLRFYVANLRDQAIFHTQDKKAFALLFFFDTKYGFVLLNENWLIFDIPVKITPFVYQHFCFSHNGTNYIVASEGKLWFQSELSSNEILDISKDAIVKDVIIGPWKEIYFNGKLVELDIFSNSFSEDEIIAITQSCERFKEGIKVLEWAKILETDISVAEDTLIKVTTDNLDVICPNHKSAQITKIMPFAVNAKEASFTCQALGGKLFLPLSSKDFHYTKNEIDEAPGMFLDYLQDFCNSNGWLNIAKSENIKEWVEFDNTSKVLKLGYNISCDGRTVQRCVAMDFFKEKIEDKACSDKNCFSCVWGERVRIHLRGLCPRSIIETHYIIKGSFFKDGIFGKLPTLIF